jgi:large subunit ribosomal protein L23
MIPMDDAISILVFCHSLDPRLRLLLRLMKVLLAPVVSEKGTFVGEKNNQYLFRVVTDATKPEIKAAVELMFSTKEKKIEVVSVQVSNVLGKEKRFGRFMGRRKDWKKAYVRLKTGQEINFLAGEAK